MKIVREFESKSKWNSKIIFGFGKGFEKMKKERNFEGKIRTKEWEKKSYTLMSICMLLTADPLRSVQVPKHVVDLECFGGRYVTSFRSPLSVFDLGVWVGSSSY